MTVVLFDLLATAFDKIPVLKHFKGYRTQMGIGVLGVSYLLDALKIGPGNIAETVKPYAETFTFLALNAKGRTPQP